MFYTLFKYCEDLPACSLPVIYYVSCHKFHLDFWARRPENRTVVRRQVNGEQTLGDIPASCHNFFKFLCFFLIKKCLWANLWRVQVTRVFVFGLQLKITYHPLDVAVPLHHLINQGRDTGGRYKFSSKFVYNENHLQGLILQGTLKEEFEFVEC